jgi:glutaredoxin
MSAETLHQRDGAAGSMAVVVYGKSNCPLCQKATAVLEFLRTEFAHGYHIVHVDITEDPALFATYREAIPVVMVGGQEIARGIVTIPAARAALARALQR